MKVSIDAMSPDEFRELVERISKYVDFRGCRTEKCINDRLKSKNSKKLDNLVKHGFAFRLFLEFWLNPHLAYKEMLGLDDEEYEELVKEKKESDKRLKGWQIKK